ncbi:MAG TPA: hypothetical protein VMS11_06475 [Solirubrobacterales bacterium]|nr:hypothetical protein [Solirubrobacterales bacterium]
MKRVPKAVLAAVAICLLTGAAAAYALTGEFKNTVVSATATMMPRELPAHGGAPIELSSITRIKNKDGSQPGTLSSIVFQLDKHGFVDTKGLPVCTMAKLAETKPAEARKRCAGALVGTGLGKAKVTLPGQATVDVSSPLSFFNGPKVGGKPTLIAHAYETIPAPKTLLVPIVIEKVAKGRYGFEAKVTLPPIAEGYGSATLAEATLGRTFERGGKEVGYLNAYCSGGRLQVHGSLSFSNGDFFPATLTSPCHLPR